MTNRALPIVMGTLVVLILCAGFVHAQTPLPTGIVRTPLTPLNPCPNGFAGNAMCVTSQIRCPNTSDIDFYYAYTPAAQGVTFRGTIVFFNGSDGTSIGFGQYVSAYTAAGYETVQVVWGTPTNLEPWETAGVGTLPTSIKVSACRPATLLKFLFQKAEQNRVPRKAMCAQGTSAGSAAVAYSLAEYGAGSYLDYVELTSGPVFSRIDIGCDPNAMPVSVCLGNLCQTGLDNPASWSDSPKYVSGAESKIDQWTGKPGALACAHTNSFSQQWQQMSVVDSLGDSTFIYNQTGVAGWLCSGPTDSSVCPGTPPSSQNNSAAEGQYFYQQVTANPLNVYRVDHCNEAEGVQDGFVPGISCQKGLTAIGNDMISHCVLQH
jgi:hypothetical protein